MPRYAYIAKSEPYKTIEAEIEADSEQDVIDKLARIGYFPVSIEYQDPDFFDKTSFFNLRKFSKKEAVTFTRQLSSLIESGVNILDGLNIIAKQTGNKYLKAVLDNVVAKIKDGKPLSESLRAYPDLFSGLYTSLIHSGEVGGTLDETLRRLADYLEKEEEFKNSLKAALTYPLFVLAVGILTVIVLLTFVIPRLVSMFEDMGQALPLPTKILISLSGVVRSYWWFILAVIGVLIFVFRRLYGLPEGKLFLNNLKLKLKIWGPITLKTEISRLARTLSLLLSSGTTIVYSLDIASSVMENQALKIEVQKLKQGINSGLSFSRSLKNSSLFPEYVTNIVGIGEEGGSLERALMRIADDYEKEVDRSLKALSRLLEPVMILVMGLIVGFIVLSMLLPIFQINLIVM